jgi:hypothetical protein
MARWRSALEAGRPANSAAAALFVLLAFAAPQATPQTISGVANLSFGSFLAGSGGAVVISPTAGGRSRTGGVLLVNQGAGAAAQFTVVGTANATYSITLPDNNAVTLSDGNGHAMTVNSFVTSPGATGTLLGGGGRQSVCIGATLIVGPNQTPGAYSGAFSVIVSYQ